MRIFSNPLVRLEFLRRFRSGAAAWGIPLIVLLPGIAVVIAYQAGTSIQTNEFGGQDNFAVAAELPNDGAVGAIIDAPPQPCLLYTSPSPRDRTRSRMPSSA